MQISQLRLRIFDGTRELFSRPTKFLVRIVDGNQKQLVWDYFNANVIDFNLPFYDNLGDNYSVLVSLDGYKQVGFYPVKLSNSYLKTLDIMLVSNTPGFSFVNARWNTAKAPHPFLGSDVDDAAGEARYDDLLGSLREIAGVLSESCRGDEPECTVAGDSTELHQAVAMGRRLQAGAGQVLCMVRRRADRPGEGRSEQHQFSEEPAPGLLHRERPIRGSRFGLVRRTFS